MSDYSGKIVSIWLRSPSGPNNIRINKTSSTSGSVILNLTDEWVRYEVYFSSFSRFFLRPTVSNTTIEIYGVQVEKGVPGDKATSYIYSDNDDLPLYSEADQIMLEDLSGISKITEVFSDDSTKVIDVAQLAYPAVYYMSSGEIKLVKME